MTSTTSSIAFAFDQMTLDGPEDSTISFRNLTNFLKSQQRRDALLSTLGFSNPLRTYIDLFSTTTPREVRVRKALFYYMQVAYLDWYAKPLFEQEGFTTPKKKPQNESDGWGKGADNHKWYD
jgi:hypothetical protein